MYNKYDSPGNGTDEGLYDKSPLEQAQETAGPIIGILKNNWKKILAGLLVLLVLFFVYDFFIGSVKPISFNVVDTEDESINATIRVSSMDGEELERTKNNQELNLKLGEYKISVLANDYQAIQQTIQITEEGPITIKMQIDKDLEMRGTIPDTFFTGQETEIILTLKNNETEPFETELILDDDCEKVMTLEYETPLYLLPGSEDLPVSLTVKNNASKSDLGENKNCQIRIKGLDITKSRVDGKYELNEFDESELSIKIGSSKTKVSFGTLDTGESSKKELKIENDTDDDLLGIIIDLEITSTEFSDPEEIKNWFSYSPANTIDSVDADSFKIININLKIPEDVSFPAGKTEEIIGGIFTVKTSYFEKNFEMSLKIEKAESKISVSGIRDSYTLRKTDGKYKIETGILEIENKGDTLLTDFDVAVVCSPQNLTWLTLETNQQTIYFTELLQNATKKIPFEIKIPKQISTNITSNCRIRVRYSDPSTVPQSTEQIVQITTQ